MYANSLLRSVVLCASCVASTTAFAHHPGGPGNSGGTGPINTISAVTIPAGITVVSVVYDQIGLDPLSDATLISATEAADHGDGHSDVHSLRSLISPSLNIAYGLTNDLTLSVRLPYVLRTDNREGEADDHGHDIEVNNLGDADGIGDVSALAQWRILNDPSGFQVALLAGFKAPTGATNEINSEGERFDTEFQPGSGSWDGIFGAALTRRYGQWSFDASVLYTAVGTGSASTDLGDRFHYNAAISYRLSPGSSEGPAFLGAHNAGHHNHAGHAHDDGTASSGPALDLILELNGEWNDHEEQAGEEDPNSGGNTIYIAPGLRLSDQQWSAFASVGIPVVTNLNGVQAEPDWRLVTGISFGF